MSAGGKEDTANKSEVDPARIACSLYFSASIGNLRHGEVSTTLAYAWGRNIKQKVKDKSTERVTDCFGHQNAGLEETAVPVPVYTGDVLSNLDGATEVACGLNHMLVLVRGQIYASGLGNRGRLGSGEEGGKSLGEAEDRWIQSPQRISFFSKKEVRRICCGSDHSLAICSAGESFEVYSWGLNTEGQCGVGHMKEEVRMPTKIFPFEGVAEGKETQRPTHIAAGGRHSLLVTSPKVKVLSKKEELAKTRGKVDKDLECGLCYAWGCGQQGRLGLGDASTSKDRPCVIEELATSKTSPRLVAAGEAHSGMVDVAGKVWMWGTGSYGRLGLGENIDTPTPHMVEGMLLDMKVGQIALGGFHTVALSATESPKVFAWGRGEALGLLQEGDSSLVTQPRLVDTSATTDREARSTEIKITQIAAGMYHTLLLLNTGEIFAYGLGANGRLGTGYTRNEVRPVKVRPVALLDTGHPHPVGFCILEPPKKGSASGHAARAAAAPTPESLVGSAAPGAVGAATQATVADVHVGSATPGGTTTSAQVLQAAWDGARGGRLQHSTMEATPSEAPTLMTEATEATSMAHYEDDGPENEADKMTVSKIQTMLREEDPKASEKELRKKEKDISGELLRYMKAISDIPKNEARLQLLRSNFDEAFTQNLRWLKAAKARASGSTAAITKQLGTYEVLCWVLQQQVAYLVSLAMCVESAQEQKVFYDVVKGLFAELEDGRTLHLFEALLRLLAWKEIEQAKKLEDVFRPGEETMGDSKDRSSALHLFSWLALSEIHCKDLVHKIMDIKEPNTLMGKLSASNDANEVFALTTKEYKTHPAQQLAQVGALTAKELENEFMSALPNFKAFLDESFKVVTTVDLPESLQKFLYYCYGAVEKRRFAAEAQQKGIRDATSAAGIVAAGDARPVKKSPGLEPLLQLYVMGILVPMLRQAPKYGGRHAFLQGKFENENDGLACNIKALATFLERMVTEEEKAEQALSQGDRLLRKYMTSVRNTLLTYLKGQINKVLLDNTRSLMLLDVGLSHFDLKPHMVMLTTTACMQLSNMLARNITKLSINDQDPVAELCKQIPLWEPHQIEAAERQDKLHVFQIKTRFLFDEKKMVICDSSNCPVPPRMSSVVLDPDLQFGDLVKPLMEGDTRFKLLETVLVESKSDFQSVTSLKALKAELEKELSTMTNYSVSHQLTISLERIQELITLDAGVDDILTPIKCCLDARKKHLGYLRDLEKGLRSVKKAQRAHARALQEAEEMQAAINNFTRVLKPPKRLKEAADQCNKQLRLEVVHETVTRFEEFGRSPAIKDLSFSPIITYTLKKLTKQKVVVSQSPQLDKQEVKISFLLANGGAEITVLVKRNGSDKILKQFALTEDKLRSLRKADEDATLELPEGAPATGDMLVTFNRAKLADLLFDAAAGR